VLTGSVREIEFAGLTIRARETKGLRHLSLLLERPGIEVHAVELEGLGQAPARPAAAAAIGDDLSIRRELGEHGPLLDPRAAAEYRARLAPARRDPDGDALRLRAGDSGGLGSLSLASDQFRRPFRAAQR
jgi:hypothetical protein